MKTFAFHSYVNILAGPGRSASNMLASTSQLTTGLPALRYSQVRGDSVARPWMAMVLEALSQERTKRTHGEKTKTWAR